MFFLNKVTKLVLQEQQIAEERGRWMWTPQLGPITKCMLSYVTVFFKCPVKKQDIGKPVCEKDLALCAELTSMQKPRPDSHFKKELAEWLNPFWKWGCPSVPSNPGTLRLCSTQNAHVHDATKRITCHRQKRDRACLASTCHFETQDSPKEYPH